jgi:hypothetical protein
MMKESLEIIRPEQAVILIRNIQLIYSAGLSKAGAALFL